MATDATLPSLPSLPPSTSRPAATCIQLSTKPLRCFAFGLVPAAMLSITVGMVGIQLHKPYVFSPNRNKQATPMACLTHFSYARKEHGARMFAFHAVKQSDDANLGLRIENDTWDHLHRSRRPHTVATLVGNVMYDICGQKNYTEDCYINAHESEGAILKPVSMGFIQHTGVSLIVYGGGGAIFFAYMALIAAALNNCTIIVTASAGFVCTMGSIGYAEFDGIAHTVFVVGTAAGWILCHLATAAAMYATLFAWKHYYFAAIAAATVFGVAVAGLSFDTEQDVLFVVMEHIALAANTWLMIFPCLALPALPRVAKSPLPRYTEMAVPAPWASSNQIHNLYYYHHPYPTAPLQLLRHSHPTAPLQPLHTPA